MTSTRLAAVLLAAAALSACASGGRGPGPDRRAGGPEDGMERGPQGRIVVPGGLLLASFDADGDYRVTPAEVEAGAARAFLAADADGDGAVTPIELSAWREVAFGSATALPGRFTYDADQNGAITETEFAAALHGIADGLADETGAAPFAALTEAQPERFSRGGGRGGMEGGGPGGPGGPGGGGPS